MMFDDLALLLILGWVIFSLVISLIGIIDFILSVLF